MSWESQLEPLLGPQHSSQRSAERCMSKRPTGQGTGVSRSRYEEPGLCGSAGASSCQLSEAGPWPGLLTELHCSPEPCTQLVSSCFYIHWLRFPLKTSLGGRHAARLVGRTW